MESLGAFRLNTHMKLYISSDLHIEFEAFHPPAFDVDIVILAGDIHVKDKGFAWAKETFPDKPVLYILGNHEYYGKAYPKHVNDLKEKAKGTNVHILENEAIEIGGVRFLGCTLWTDFRLLGDPRMAGYEATQKMTDYRKIRISPSFRKLRSIDTAGIHAQSCDWLKHEVQKKEGCTKIVITHHAPSPRSIPESCREDILSAAYASNLDDFIEKSDVKLWIHGHLHWQSDYCIGNTRVICNPRGYPKEANEAFIPDFTLEV